MNSSVTPGVITTSTEAATELVPYGHPFRIFGAIIIGVLSVLSLFFNFLLQFIFIRVNFMTLNISVYKFVYNV